MSQLPDISKPAARLTRASRWTVSLSVAAVAGMIGLTYASAPLYRMFCQVTGFDGTPKRVAEAPKEVLTRQVTIRFDTSVSPSLAWEFEPAQGPQTLKVGEVGLAFFHAKNLSGKALSGTASFNVTPDKVGAYFSKIECFCFTEQRLAAGQEVDMPVQYFIDPEIEKDENMHDVKTITLSYTFYPTHPKVAVLPSPSSSN